MSKTKISDKAIIENLTTDLMSNLEKTAGIGIQAANNQVSSVLNKVADILNVDPNQTPDIIVKELGDRLTTFNDALQTPDGKKLLNELTDIGLKMVKTIEEPVKEGQRIFNQMLMDQLRNFEKLAWGAIGLVPVIGDASEIIRIIKDLFQSFIKVMKAVSGISVQTTNALDNLSGIIGEQAEVFTNMSKLVQTAVTENINEGNNKLKNILKVASSSVDDQTRALEKEAMSIAKRVGRKTVTKAFQRGGVKIAKRTNKSIAKFLYPATNIKQKHSIKRRTRKRR